MTSNIDLEVKSYKLNEDGTLTQIPMEDVHTVFKSVNVLAFYVPTSKRLYIWIGKSTDHYVRQHIPAVEQTIRKEHPEYRILRHFTMEEDNETWDFFSDTKINEEQAKGSISKWKIYQKSIYDEIDSLKTDANNAYKNKDYQKVINLVERIIDLALNIKNFTIIKKQLEFLANTRSSLYKDTTASTGIETVKTLIKQIDEIEDRWQERMPKTKGSELEEEIKTIKSAISRRLEAEDLQQIPEFLEKLTLMGDKSSNQEIKDETNDFVQKTQNEIKKIKYRIQIKSAIERDIREAKERTDNKDFDSAINRLNKAEKLAQDNNLALYIQKVVEQKKLIEQKQKGSSESLLLLEKLEKNIKQYTGEKKYDTALNNCEKAITVAEDIGDNVLTEKYRKLKDELTQLAHEYHKKQEEEQKELLETAKELEEIIEVEKNVLPQMDTYTVDEIIGDLSPNIEEMHNQLNSLFDSHRVEVKNEIKSNNIIRSKSGEVLEISKATQVEETSEQHLSEDSVKQVKFSVNSVLDNPFDELIEEAIIEDIIPYNFEINEIKLNDETPGQTPEEKLTKDGLELKWTLNNIEPKEKVEINYNLRKRVSRTIILSLENQINIIKTHSSLKPLDLDGLYNANLEFANKFKEQLSGVVIEDIVPMLYIYSIKAPEDRPSSEMENKVGSLVKWRLNNIPIDYSSIYRYQLIEIYRFESLKIQVNKLSEEALNALEKGQVNSAYSNYEKVENLLEEYE
ncbi:MAG: hypothetical protein GF364_07940 [Candidatus Lokiarchaeota archaeon]|nr:hypothetical protein [Candidatus Lokiarchaeota archaeon]